MADVSLNGLSVSR